MFLLSQWSAAPCKTEVRVTLSDSQGYTVLCSNVQEGGFDPFPVVSSCSVQPTIGIFFSSFLEEYPHPQWGHMLTLDSLTLNSYTCLHVLVPISLAMAQKLFSEEPMSTLNTEAPALLHIIFSGASVFGFIFIGVWHWEYASEEL